MRSRPSFSRFRLPARIPEHFPDPLMATRSKSSQRWLREHFADPYVKKAQAEGLRSRAAYKLEELLERDRLIRPGMTIVDLGAAHRRSWSQYVPASRWATKRPGVGLGYPRDAADLAGR